MTLKVQTHNLTRKKSTEFHNKLKLKEKLEKPVSGEDKGDSGVDTHNSEGMQMKETLLTHLLL